MSELNIKIRKLQDNGSTFRATPESLYMGGVGSAKVDTLCFDVPEEWKGCAITLHVQRLSGTLPDPQLLDEKNRAVVDQRWTKEKQGLWMLMAVGADGYTAMTKPGRYTCYETIDRDSTTETITQSVYEQFVALVKKETAEANRAAKNAAASAEIAKNFESTITATGEQVQREITATADQTKQAIDEKAKAALASIPEDYTALSESVGQVKEDLEDLNDNLFGDVVNLADDKGNYRKSEGWKLVGDGTRTADASSEIIGYHISSGDFIHVELKKYTDCVCYFATDYLGDIIGNVITSTINRYIVVPDGATWLMVSQKLNDTENHVYRAYKKVVRQSQKIDDTHDALSGKDIITFKKGANRFDASKAHFLDGYYVLSGEFIKKDGYFVTHLMDVEENRVYYKNESADGIFYDKYLNVIGFHSSSKSFTTPSSCYFYRTSASNSIAGKFYVSEMDAISKFSDTLQFTTPAANAIKEIAKSSSEIKTEIHSVSSAYVNTSQSINAPVVTFIDDDGRKEVYTRLLPIIKEKNIKYGLAIVSKYIDDSDVCMTLEQLKECHDTGLIETLSHTYTMNSSLVGLTEDELNYQFSMSKKWLADNGFENRGIVYPTNNANELVRTVARQYFDYGMRGTYFNDKGYLDHSIIDRIAFGSFTSTNPMIAGVTDNGSLKYYKACVDKAVANGEWLIFMTHIADQSTEQDNVLKELIDYIQTSNVQIVSPSDGFELKRNQVNVGDLGDKFLFIGNKNFATNMIGYQYRLRDEITGEGIASEPVTSFIPDSVTLSYYNVSSNAGYPTSAGVLETFYCKTSPDFSWQKWTAYPTCKQQMRFWDNTNKAWFDWVEIN